MNLVFDLESTLIPKDPRELPDTIWCGVAIDVDTGEEFVARPGELDAFMHLLLRATRLIGHNITRFDLPLIERHYDEVWTWDGEMFDTLMASRLIYASNLWTQSVKFQRNAGRSPTAQEARIPSKLLMSHSLEAWAYRLGMRKEFANVDNSFWSEFSEDMLTRCLSDARANVELYKRFLTVPAKRGWDVCSEQSLLNESHFSYLMGRMERTGVGFDSDGARKLAAGFEDRRQELGLELKEKYFPAWVKAAPGQKTIELCREGDSPYSVYKATRTLTKGRDWPVTTAGAHTKLKLMEFNPGSDEQVADRLRLLYGWQPREFTPTGQAETGDYILGELEYDCIPALREWRTVNKRLSQIETGDQAWLKKVTDEGIIFGRIHTTGTRTSRCSHNSPNLGQVPRVGKPHGAECRELFHPVTEGWKMVGADASGLEMRMLANRLAAYDGGEFAKVILESDVHTEWMKHTKMFYRDWQKNFGYTIVYGGGDETLGRYVLKDWRQAFDEGLTDEKPPSDRHAANLGKKAKGSLLSGMPALAEFMDQCAVAYKRGYIRGLDGRILACPSQHGAPNDVLQSDGAIVMKYAGNRFWQCKGPCHGEQWNLMLHVHDEFQAEVAPGLVDKIGAAMVDAIVWAGEHLGLRLPLDGEYKIGNNWRETH